MVNIIQPPKGALRIVGNDLEQILETAMQRVTRERAFYENNIKECLLKHNWSMVSCHSCNERNGISIIYDPENQIPVEELETLTTKELRRKYKFIK